VFCWDTHLAKIRGRNVLFIVNVGIVSNSLAKEFYIKANKANWRKAEPQRVRNIEKPLLFNQLVYRAVNEEGISLQRGAELLQIPVAEMDEYCGLVEV